MFCWSWCRCGYCCPTASLPTGVHSSKTLIGMTLCLVVGVVWLVDGCNAVLRLVSAPRYCPRTKMEAAHEGARPLTPVNCERGRLRYHLCKSDANSENGRNVVLPLIGAAAASM
jgi:hypothetical protein